MNDYSVPEDQPSDETCVGTGLSQCANCGMTGTPPRTDPDNHDCSEFLDRRELEASAETPAEVRTDGGRTRVDADKHYCRSLPGGTVVLAPTYTASGPFRSYGRSVPIALAGIVSPRDLRSALRERGYSYEEIDRAADTELSRESELRAVHQAESIEATSQ